MGLHNPAEAKNQYIKIWLHHLKVSRILFLFVSQLMPPCSTTKSAAMSSAKSSRLSLQSAVSASSLSKVIRTSAKVIRHGVKRIKKGASVIARPIKRAKHVLSNVSSPVDSDAESGPAGDEDQDSLNTTELPEVEVFEVFEVNSDGDELETLEKELGMSPCFSLHYLTHFTSQQQRSKLGGPQYILSSNPTSLLRNMMAVSPTSSCVLRRNARQKQRAFDAIKTKATSPQPPTSGITHCAALARIASMLP